MKKSIMSFAVTCTLFCLFTGCGHSHDWKPATCSSAKICSICGETEGQPLEHDWNDATCLDPKTCSICGETEGASLGHDWKDATCTVPKTCTRCGAKEGALLAHDFQFERKEEVTCTKSGYSVYACSVCGTTDVRDKISALGHDWKDATCTAPKTCARCGRTEGSLADHDAPDLTCTSSGVCLICGEELPALGHDFEPATCTDPATCKRCGYADGEALGHTVSNGVCERCGIEVYETISGHGDDVLSNISVGDGLYRVHVTNSGKHNFAVWIYDKDEDRDLAVNTIGNYDGYCFLEGSAPYTFEIESHGNWTVTIERIGTTTETSFSGSGDYVTDIFSASSCTWQITHDGDHNFAIWLWTTDGRDLIVNEIGKYEGRKRLSIPSGSNAFLVIEADGNWEVKPVD